MVQNANMQKKILNVPFVKLFSKYFFHLFMEFLLFFHFGPFIKGKSKVISCIFTLYCLKMVLKVEIIENSLKSKRYLRI